MAIVPLSHVLCKTEPAGGCRIVSIEYQSLIDHVKAGIVLSIIARIGINQCSVRHVYTRSDGGHHCDCDYVTATQNDCDVQCLLSHGCMPSLPKQHSHNSKLLLTNVILTLD